jgi:hypothetical protein
MSSILVQVIVGGLFLMYHGLIDYRIPLIILAMTLICLLVFPVPVVIRETAPEWRWLAFRMPEVGWPLATTFANYEIMASPLLFMAFFLATSPSVRPMSRRARTIFAVLVGAVAVTAGVVLNYRDYFPPNFDSDFLRGREKYFSGSYQWAFYTHTAAGPVALVLGTIGDKTVVQGFSIIFTASATDANPGQSQTFSLDLGAPDGATIDPMSGQFIWRRINEGQGPGMFSVTIRVTVSGPDGLRVRTRAGYRASREPPR